MISMAMKMFEMAGKEGITKNIELRRVSCHQLQDRPTGLKTRNALNPNAISRSLHGVRILYHAGLVHRD